MRTFSSFFVLLVLIAALVCFTIDAAPLDSVFRRKNLGGNIRVSDLPEKLRDGPGAPGLAFQFQYAFNTRNITLLSSLIAPNATFFISSWGPARVGKAHFVEAMQGYFGNTAVIQEDLFLRVMSDDFVLGERIGADILAKYNQVTNTSGNVWWDLFPGFFRLTSCNQGTLIDSVDTFSILTQQGNTTMTTQLIQQMFQSYQQMDTDKVMSYAASDLNFNLHPNNGLGPCPYSCATAQLQTYFSGISNGRLKVTIESIAVNFNFVVVKRTTAAALKDGSSAQASIMFEMDVITLDASYKIQNWDWYYFDPSQTSNLPIPASLPLGVQFLNKFVEAQQKLDLTALSNLFADNARIFDWRAGFAPISKSEAMQIWKTQMEQANQVVYSPIIGLVNKENVVCGRMNAYAIMNLDMNEANFYNFWFTGFCLYVNGSTNQIAEYGAFASPGFPYPQSNASSMEQTANNVYAALQSLNVDQMLTYFSDDFNFRQVPNANNLPAVCNKQCFATFLSKVMSMCYKGLIKPYPLYMAASYNHLISIRKNFFVFTPPGATTPTTLIGAGTDIFRMDYNFKITAWENIEGGDF